MLDKEYRDRIEREQSYAQLNRIWGQIDALYDLFMWFRSVRPECIDKLDLIDLVETEILRRANKYRDEVK